MAKFKLVCVCARVRVVRQIKCIFLNAVRHLSSSWLSSVHFIQNSQNSREKVKAESDRNPLRPPGLSDQEQLSHDSQPYIAAGLILDKIAVFGVRLSSHTRKLFFLAKIKIKGKTECFLEPRLYPKPLVSGTDEVMSGSLPVGSSDSSFTIKANSKAIKNMTKVKRKQKGQIKPLLSPSSHLSLHLAFLCAINITPLSQLFFIFLSSFLCSHASV